MALPAHLTLTPLHTSCASCSLSDTSTCSHSLPPQGLCTSSAPCQGWSSPAICLLTPLLRAGLTQMSLLSDAPSLTTRNTHFPKSATEIPFHSCFTNVSKSNFKWFDEFKVLLMTYAFVVKRSSVNAINLFLFLFLFVCRFGSFSKCLSFGRAFHH